MTDPKRLSELGSEAPDGLRNLLHVGRDDLPNKAQMDGLELRLASLLGPIAAGAPAPVPTPPSAPAPGAAGAGSAAPAAGGAIKALAIGAVVVAVAGVAWLSTSGRRAEEAPKSAAPVEAPAAPPPLTSAPANGPETPPASPQSARVEATQAPHAASETAHRPGAAKEESVSEAALLAQAQAALGKNPRRALALTREHKRRFPDGALAQEREVIAIEALKRVGDDESAQRRATEFSERYPDSAHRRRVRGATSADPVSK